jgi:hypothetical protein
MKFLVYAWYVFIESMVGALYISLFRDPSYRFHMHN